MEYHANGPSSQRLAQQDSWGCQRPTAIYAVEIWDRQGPRRGATVHSDYATTTTIGIIPAFPHSFCPWDLPLPSGKGFCMGWLALGHLYFVVHAILIGRITKSVVTIMTLLPILEYDWTVDNERHMSEVTSPEQKLPNKMPTLWWCVVRKLNITKWNILDASIYFRISNKWRAATVL